jgi:hypothetical protein
VLDLEEEGEEGGLVVERKRWRRGEEGGEVA